MRHATRLALAPLFAVALGAVSRADGPPPVGDPHVAEMRRVDRPPTPSANPPLAPDPVEREAPPADTVTKVEPERRGPKYNTLRWKDDFGYLAGPPESYVSDWFDPIKLIPLDDDWRLSIGGSLRGRLESRTNNFINLPTPSQDTTFLTRGFLHMDLAYRQTFRVYVEGVYAAIADNDSPPLPIAENRGDLHQYFVDWRILGDATPLTLRVGRQELLYGAQRFISPLDWANTRRRFDGIKLFYEDAEWNIDAFHAYLTPDVAAGFVDRFDQFDERQYLSGVYGTYKGIPNHGIDAYYLFHHNGNPLRNGDGVVGSQNINMVGGRFWGKAGGWDYDTEAAAQFGEFAGDPVHAYAWAAEAGYTFRDVDWRPRIGLGLDFATGDSNPSDGRHQTFNQLYPLGHKYLGLIDLVARQNVWAAQGNIALQPHERLQLRFAYHAFWLAENSDGLYNAGGVLLRRDASGRSPHDIGQELDITLEWKIDVHSALLLGYSHFWGGGFLDETGLGDDAHFTYLQYEFKF